VRWNYLVRNQKLQKSVVNFGGRGQSPGSKHCEIQALNISQCVRPKTPKSAKMRLAWKGKGQTRANRKLPSSASLFSVFTSFFFAF
jgi:hypothetical protein